MGKMETGTRIARQRRLWLYARYKICGALDLPLRDLVGQHILYPMRVRLGRSLIILPPLADRVQHLGQTRGVGDGTVSLFLFWKIDSGLVSFFFIFIFSFLEYFLLASSHIMP